MAKDYASRGRRSSASPARLPGWIWLLAGLSFGLVVATAVYIGRPPEPIPSGTVTAAPKKPRPKIDIPPKEEPRFGFYTLLESEQVVVSGDPTPAPQTAKQKPREIETSIPVATETVEESNPATPGTPAQTNEKYLILAGSFRDASNAEKHKATLALTGIEAGIETVQGQDNVTWHRVRIGPRNSLESAKLAVDQLKINGFDGRVVTVK